MICVLTCEFCGVLQISEFYDSFRLGVRDLISVFNTFSLLVFGLSVLVFFGQPRRVY